MSVVDITSVQGPPSPPVGCRAIVRDSEDSAVYWSADYKPGDPVIVFGNQDGVVIAVTYHGGFGTWPMRVTYDVMLDDSDGEELRNIEACHVRSELPSAA